MSFLTSLIEWFGLAKSNNTGLLLDDPTTIATLPRHELFGSARKLGGGPSKDWGPLCPPFRYQGSSYFCVGYSATSVASILEKQETGHTVVFSPWELFYRAGGSQMGAYISRAAECMKSSVVLETDKPSPDVRSWGYAMWNQLRTQSTASPEALTKGKNYAIKGYASVKTDRQSLKDALQDSPLVVAIALGSGYWVDPAPIPRGINAYHAVVLTKVDDDGTLTIFDSLTYKQGFDGFHRLSPGYPILSAYSYINLPDSWRDQQAAVVQNDNAVALGHFGKPRDLAAEQKASAALTAAINANPTVGAAVGRDYLIYVNCVAYGGFSVQDVLNSLTSERRGGPKLFNFNEVRHK